MNHWSDFSRRLFLLCSCISKEQCHLIKAVKVLAPMQGKGCVCSHHLECRGREKLNIFKYWKYFPRVACTMLATSSLPLLFQYSKLWASLLFFSWTHLNASLAAWPCRSCYCNHFWSIPRHIRWECSTPWLSPWFPLHPHRHSLPFLTITITIHAPHVLIISISMISLLNVSTNENDNKTAGGRSRKVENCPTRSLR